MHVIRAEGSAIRAVEVVVAVAVEGATQALCIAVVYTGRPDRQTHSPLLKLACMSEVAEPFKLQT